MTRRGMALKLGFLPLARHAMRRPRARQTLPTAVIDRSMMVAISLYVLLPRRREQMALRCSFVTFLPLPMMSMLNARWWPQSLQGVPLIYELASSPPDFNAVPRSGRTPLPIPFCCARKIWVTRAIHALEKPERLQCREGVRHSERCTRGELSVCLGLRWPPDARLQQVSQFFSRSAYSSWFQNPQVSKSSIVI